MSKKLEEKLKRAERAKNKKPLLGPEVELDKFTEEAEAEVKSLEELPEDYKEDALRAGVVTGEQGRAGTFFQVNQKVLCARTSEPGLEVLSTTQALEKYDWL